MKVLQTEINFDSKRRMFNKIVKFVIKLNLLAKTIKIDIMFEFLNKWTNFQPKRMPF